MKNKLAEALKIIRRAETDIRQLLGHGGWVVSLDMFGDYLNQEQEAEYIHEARALGFTRQVAPNANGDSLVEYYELGDEDRTDCGKAEMTIFAGVRDAAGDLQRPRC